MQEHTALLCASTTQLIEEFVKRSLGTQQVSLVACLQSLWSGQGYIVRLASDRAGHESVIVKYIAPTPTASHPRGWNTNASFLRKSASYEVESCWYQHYASQCDSQCRVPALLGYELQKAPQQEPVRLLLMEDLSTDYPMHPELVSLEAVAVCLQWLAAFHARFLFNPGEGLWPQGSYWHLATRQDEWQAMADQPVKHAAGWLDAQLREARFQTLIHGDAKLANFCFSSDLRSVAAVDFQYVGRGCGISDVVYLLGSCLDEQACEDHEQALLDVYFSALKSAVQQRLNRDNDLLKRMQDECIAGPESWVAHLECEWRSLYSVAWTDFYRFLLGWMPEHRKINRYTLKLSDHALSLWQADTRQS